MKKMVTYILLSFIFVTAVDVTAMLRSLQQTSRATKIPAKRTFSTQPSTSIAKLKNIVKDWQEVEQSLDKDIQSAGRNVEYYQNKLNQLRTSSPWYQKWTSNFQRKETQLHNNIDYLRRVEENKRTKKVAIIDNVHQINLILAEVETELRQKDKIIQEQSQYIKQLESDNPEKVQMQERLSKE